MLALRVNPASRIPPSAQIVAAVLDATCSGELAVGAKLPSVRVAAVEAMVNPNTIAKAYRELEALGVVRAKNGSGVFVDEDGLAAAHAMRRDETSAAVREAVAAAMRSGHDLAAVTRVVGEVFGVNARVDRRRAKRKSGAKG